jgi:hypothetical protein
LNQWGEAWREHARIVRVTRRKKPAKPEPPEPPRDVELTFNAKSGTCFMGNNLVDLRPPWRLVRYVLAPNEGGS